MDAKVTWEQGMTFTGTANTGFEVSMGADTAVGGDNDGFRPLELMAVSLAGCTAMDVISILKKKQQTVSAFEVNVRAIQAHEHPHVFTHVIINYLVTGQQLDETALRRAIELSATQYCPAQSMLNQVVPIKLKYEIYEGKSALERALIKTGTFVLPEKEI